MEIIEKAFKYWSCYLLALLLSTFIFWVLSLDLNIICMGYIIFSIYVVRRKTQATFFFQIWPNDSTIVMELVVRSHISLSDREKETHCISGDEENLDGLCALPQNDLADKIFLVLWWWMTGLLVLNVLWITSRILKCGFHTIWWLCVQHKLTNKRPTSVFGNKVTVK